MFTESKFEKDGKKLNEVGAETLARLISEHIKAVLDGKTDLGVVHAIERGTERRTTLRRPLKARGIINFKEVEFLLDTGSGVNCVYPDMVNRVPYAQLQILSSLLRLAIRWSPWEKQF